MDTESRHIAVIIDRPASEVYDYTANPENLVHWAAGLSASVDLVDGQWVADSPMGRIVVEFAPPNELGVLDHYVTLPTGETFYNPMRVFSTAVDSQDSEVVFSVRRAAGATQAEFDKDVAAVSADLSTLRRLLEQR